jgi:hypothetical protein
MNGYLSYHYYLFFLCYRSPDERSPDLAVPTLNDAPSTKKLKLMSGVPHDTENHIQSMAYSSQKTKKDLETKETNMYKFFKGSNLQTSTPIGSPIPVSSINSLYFYMTK